MLMLLRFFIMLLALPMLFLLLLDLTSSSATMSAGPHITDVNVLLPPKMTHPVEYRLQGSGGCFEWSWDHHDILALVPEYNPSSHCSNSTLLKSIAPYTGRKETAVYATDINTGIVIRCKVYIDIIFRIQIFHNSVKIDLDGLATLRVRAFDSEENEFSSLAGVPFIWEMCPKIDGLPRHLVHVPLKDSPLSDCGGLCGDLDVQVKLEESGVFSDLCVVKGVEVGQEIVSVHLVGTSFQRMQDKVIFTVAEAMSLDPPSPIFVLIGAVIHYNLKFIRNNVPHAVPLPSPSHRWSTLNSSVAQVDLMTGELRAMNLGVTTVIVEDIRVDGHTQTSSLHVVLPGTLLMYTVPLSPNRPFETTKFIRSAERWYLVSGRRYMIHVKVFSQGPEPQEIYISDSDDLKLCDDGSKLWSILPVVDYVVPKGNHKILEAFGHGLGKLRATLTYRSGNEESKEVLEVSQEVMVCDQMKFSSKKADDENFRTLLPWAPGVNQEFELRVTGGCAMTSSNYHWVSSDGDTVSVSATGIARSERPGRAVIRVVSAFDIFNYDKMLVEVSLPSSMIILQDFPLEIPVGSRLQVALTLKAPDGLNFDRCDSFNLITEWRSEEESFSIGGAKGESDSYGKLETSEVEGLLSGPPCSWTYIYASKPGRTVIRAELSKDDLPLDRFIDGRVVLEASQVIAAYTPLIVHEFSDGNQFGGYWFNLTNAQVSDSRQNLERIHLAPGSSFDVKLQGGPVKWGQDVEYIETLEIFDEASHIHQDGNLVRQIFSMYGTVYQVTCTKSGTFKLVFKRGNLIGINHPLPVVSEVQLSLMCYLPFSVALLVDEAVNSYSAIFSSFNAERSEQRIRTAPIKVANGRRIRLSAVGLSEKGKAFSNSSSLHLNWEFGNCSELAFLDDTSSLAKTKSSWERFLVLQNASGFCTIRTTVIGFQRAICQDCFNALLENHKNDITDAVILHIVPSLRVDPYFNLLYFSSDARMNLSVTGGSCSLRTVVNDSQIIDVIEIPHDLLCLQLILVPKQLGSALVSVYDRWLTPPFVASSIIQVADVDWIQIKSAERVSLLKGSSLTFGFLAGIYDGRVFDSSQYMYMNIDIRFDNKIVEMVANYTFGRPRDEHVILPSFTIKGSQLGITGLYLIATRHSGSVVLSPVIEVEVYERPIIHPSDIFLVPGGSYVLGVRGGPEFSIRIEYASTDDKTAKVDKLSGLLSAASPGNSTLVATFFGDGDMLCQAFGKVLVGVPSSAMLSVQSEVLAVGRKMPISPSLSEGNLFSFHERCSSYKWTIEDEKVLGFLEPVEYLDVNNLGFLRVLHGRSAGKTSVKVSFTCNFSYSGFFSESRFYSASISLRVLADLPLALGSTVTWLLPPHYTSADLLPLSADASREGDAIRKKGTITYSVLGQCRKMTGAVQGDIVIDGDKIKTTDSDVLACIEAKDRWTGISEVASCVRVADVAQARIMAEDVFVLTLAVDSDIELPIRYYDFMGNPFHEAYNVTVFEAETNHPDVVTVSAPCDGDAKICLRGISKGKALLRIAFTNNPQKTDYVMIVVGAQLRPLNPILRPGSRLNFNVEGIGGEASGHWFSANSSILYVDMSSGVAEAVGEGSTQIYYQDDKLNLQTEVTVVKGTLVTVDAPKGTLTNAPPFPVTEYLFPVRVSGDYNQTCKAVQDGKISFSCRVHPPYVGFAEPRSDPYACVLSCAFFPYSPELLLSFLPSHQEIGKRIPISVDALLFGETNVSGSASALFICGFAVLEMNGKSSFQLNLSQTSNRTFITVVGNTDVSISWDNRVGLLVTAISGEASPRGGRVVYEVKVTKVGKLQDKLVITLPATLQMVEIDVNYEPERIGNVEVGEPYQITVAFVVGALSLLALPLLMYWMFNHRGLKQHHGPNTTHVTAPTTTGHKSPQAVSDQSPRTPQPFIDYVRRTIDETPYYRQDFRRRGDSQNTY